MLDKLKTLLYAGILLCLIVIAYKPVPMFSYNPPAQHAPVINLPETNGDQVVQLGENRIGIVNTKDGQISVLEYDAKQKTFQKVATYNYTMKTYTK